MTDLLSNKTRACSVEQALVLLLKGKTTQKNPSCFYFKLK